MKNFIVVMFALIAIGLFSSAANAQMMGVNGSTGWGGFGGILMILWWILIIAGIVTLIRWMIMSSHNNQKSPLDTLKERYAKGEIDKKEFEERKRDLGF